MKKRKLLLGLGLALSLTAGAQMPKWCMPPYLVDFTGAAPTIASSSLLPSTGKKSFNAAYDQAGNMLFYVSGGQITTPAGVAVGTALDVQGETAVIPVPGFCTRYFVAGVTTPVAPSNKVYLNYSMVETAGGISIVPDPASGGDIAETDEVGYNKVGLAVSMRQRSKVRFLFTTGAITNTDWGIKKFLITGAGISFQSVVTSFSGVIYNTPLEVDMYENSVNHSMKIAWGGDAWPGPPGPSERVVHVVNMDNAGNYVSRLDVSIPDLSQVNGLEFASNGTKILLNTTSATSTSLDGIVIANLSAGTSTLVPGTTAFSNAHTELASDGKYYTINKLTKELTAIDPSTGAPTGTGLYFPFYTPSTGNVLPDQVDGEKYLDVNFNAELMMRDNNFDYGVEPNEQANLSGDLAESPDLWNRRNSSGSMSEHQNPGYSSAPGMGNLMFVKIKNIGCKPSLLSHVKMYWTVSSTGETWPGSWNGTETIGGVPKGGELTVSSTSTLYVPGFGYQIPPLNPGVSVTLGAKWYPPNPALYSPALPYNGICMLARINDNTNDPMHDEQTGPMTVFRKNVYANNNIVTRNTTLVDFPGTFNTVPPPRYTSVVIHNPFDISDLFNINFGTIAQADVAFANNGTVIMRVDDGLWNSWTQAGAQSEGLQVSNAQQHEFVVTDISKAVLKNVSMQADENMVVTFGFSLNNPTQVQSNYNFKITQERSGWQQGDQLYSSDCYFVVRVNGPDDSDSTGFPDDSLQQNNISTGIQKIGADAASGKLYVSPNPSVNGTTVKLVLADQESIVSVGVFDLSGKLVKKISDYRNDKGSVSIPVSTTDLSNSLYIINVQTTNGLRSAKLSIAH